MSMGKMKASVFEEADTRAPLLTVLGVREKPKKKPSTRYALVEWEDGEFSIEAKKDLREFYWDRTTVICDDQPYKVLAKMYILANEKG